MKIKLNKTINRVLKRTMFKMQRHAPEILVATGVVGGITATVMACKATLKAQDVLIDAKNQIEDIKETPAETEEETKEQTQQIKKVYISTGIELAKLYAPAVTIGVASTVSVLASHNIMRHRVATLVTAYGTLDNAFREYRGRVAEKFGIDQELEAYHDVKQIEGETRDENGLVLAEKKDNAIKVDGYSQYARCFDEYNPNWKKDPAYNLDWLRGVQRYLTCKLELDGFLFLNDAYRELGFEPTPAGQLVGWIYDPNRTDPGDNVVSFGLYNPEHGAALGDFINGYNNAVFLDFNVDGVIVDRI